MQRFDVKEPVRDGLLPHHRAFQATVCQVANELMGNTQAPLEGILQYEGGVRVNNRPIKIGDDYVRDGGTASPEPTREEIATAQAIEQVASAFQKIGAAALTASGGELYSGHNPLHIFFDAADQRHKEASRNPAPSPTS